MPKAEKAFEEIKVYPDGYILRIRIWKVAAPVPPSRHTLKYSCFYGRTGERTVCYDNERGKGDHRHYSDREEHYDFSDVETLIADFIADVRAARGGDA